MSVSTVLAGLDAITAEQEELYVHLHQNPELSMQETETAAAITKRLESYGYEVQQIGGGVVGVMKNGEGPTVLFRADIDALPVEEQTGLPYASTKTTVDRDGNTVSVMHACGHDTHITALLGAAKLMAENKDQWSGTYIPLFQPAEETAEGAKSMVDDGLVDKIPKIDVALGQHVLASPPTGKVGFCPGPFLSVGTSIKVTITGKGSHGSMPHLGVDPVLLASTIVVRLQSIVARDIAPSDFGVVTVGSIQSGFKSNVIPETATLLINTRAYDMAVREKILAGIERIVRAECQGAGAPVEPTFEYYDIFPLTDNDVDVTNKVREAMIDALGEDRVEWMPPAPASEDFSHIPDAFGVPYTYFGFGGFEEGKGIPNHNPKFGPVMQPTLRTGTEAAVVAAMAYLGS